MLKDFFEEQLTAVVTNNGDITIGTTSFSPVSILQKDEDAYQDSYQTWLDEIWIPEQTEILENIWKLDNDNRPRFKKLSDAFQRKQLIPFIGSGMSSSSGLPTWREFLVALSEKSEVSIDHLNQLLDQGKFEEAFDLFLDIKVMNRRLLHEQIHNRLQVKETSINGAIRLIPDIFSEIVITTNLDNILEKLYTYSDAPFDDVLICNDIGTFRELRGDRKRMLLKIHGCCEKMDRRILGKEEYDEAYCEGTGFHTTLAFLCQSYHFLFLGCSLSIDRTVRLLADVATKDKGMPNHFAFMSVPDNSDLCLKRERELELTRYGIFPIWYNGDHDESIGALLTGILHELQ